MSRRVILDTDWWTDVDDAVAVRLLARYHHAGWFKLIAAVVNGTLAKGPGSLDAALRDEGLSVPIGTCSPTHNPGGTPPYQAGIYDGYYHRVGLVGAVPTAVSVLRAALAAAPDRGIDYVSIGYLNNMGDLLDSPADGVSALAGEALVAAKVRRTWIMAGAFPSGSENNLNRGAVARAAAVKVATRWPGPMTWSGYEVGATVVTGANLSSLQGSDLVADALLAHGSASGRNSWDPMTVELAAYDDPAAAGYTVVEGRVVVDPSTGANTFTPIAGGPHRYTVKTLANTAYRDRINALLLPDAAAPPPPFRLRLQLGGVARHCDSVRTGGAAVSAPVVDRP